MIRLTQVFKAYGAQEALKGVDLEVPAGECAVLIGPSGCGKSTLLKSINRMVGIDAGRIEVNGMDIADYAPELLRRQIGYCIQGVGLFPHFTVQDNIAVVPRLLKWPEAKIEARVKSLMEMSGLPDSFRFKKPKALSGGEAQRVGVCRALAADPPVLLMDEPFGAVDPLTRERLQLAFMEIQRALRKTVVFVTHDVEEAILLADRVILMHRGVILDAGTPGKFAGDIEDAFVQNFLGSEYPLKLLKRYAARDLGLASLPVWLGEVPESGRLVLRAESNLIEVLSEMMRLGLQEVPVESENGRCVRVGYDALAGYLKEVSTL